jgi:alkylation response protein AidB-like acyl-CoA dehydrogenase
MHAGHGFIMDYTVEKPCRDRHVTATYEGPSKIYRIVIACSVLGK